MAENEVVLSFSLTQEKKEKEGFAGDLRRWKSLISAIDFALGLRTPWEQVYLLLHE